MNKFICTLTNLISIILNLLIGKKNSADLRV